MASIKDLKVCLVGGGGFIGHNLAIHLKKLGAKVDIVDSLQVNNLYAFGRAGDDIVNRDLYIKIINQRLDLLREHGIPLHLQDAREYHALSAILADIKPEVVIQLAAVSHANKSNKDPYSTFDHSLRTLENALDVSRSIGVKHFIFFSSSMVYGNFDGQAVTEETICNPIGIYGALKYAGEKMVIAYNQVFNMPFTIVRPSALYGERCVSRRVGQIFLENALFGKDLTINGDGSEGLDFTYIEDLCHGIERVIESEKSKGEIFNLTYGQARPVREMAEMVCKAFPGIKINYAPKDKLMPDRGTLSVEKARRLIGYNPQYPLDKGYARYIEWYKTLKK